MLGRLHAPRSRSTKFEQGWERFPVLSAQTCVQEAIGVKAHLDVNFTDTNLSLDMGSYQSDYDPISS